MLKCDYAQSPRHVASVVAEYALPADLNPLSDFYYGCDASRKQAWSSAQRIFFQASGSRWSYVEVADPGRQLPDGAVPSFESVALELLHRVEGDAHVCKINSTTPTLVQHLYLFGFEFFHTSNGVQAFGGVAARSAKNPLIPDGSFTTVSTPASTIVTEVNHVTAPPVAVQVVANGKRHAFSLRLTGIDFLQKPPTQRLRLRVVVGQSSYAACPRGSRGTLTITRSSLDNASTAPAVIRLDLCGSLFARGTYRGTAEIITG